MRKILEHVRKLLGSDVVKKIEEGTLFEEGSHILEAHIVLLRFYFLKNSHQQLLFVLLKVVAVFPTAPRQFLALEDLAVVADKRAQVWETAFARGHPLSQLVGLRRRRSLRDRDLSFRVGGIGEVRVQNAPALLGRIKGRIDLDALLMSLCGLVG